MMKTKQRNRPTLVLVACFFTVALLTGLLAGCGSGSADSSDDGVITAMSFNIRYANPNDGVHVWENRKDWVVEIIDQSDAQVVGLQEALKHQVDVLDAELTNYAWVGVGRSDGKNEGEFSPIFFDTTRVNLVSSSTFWLSSDPDSVGSEGWDAALPRIVTWASFRSKNGDAPFYHFNTHFDHRGEIARAESASLIRTQIGKLAEGKPVILTGDFNSLDSEDPYLILTEPIPADAMLLDSRFVAQQEDVTTFRGFEIGSTETRRIDYIFHSSLVTALDHYVYEKSRDGRYPSDHLPVVATFKLEP